MKKIYTAVGIAQGGRGGGTAKTDDGMLDLILAHPKKMGGDGQGTNPEQLFAVGYSSCFLGAMKFVNSKAKKPLTLSPDSTVTAHVSFGPRSDKKGFGIEVKLDVSLPGVKKAEATALAKKAHVVCPYSHAIRKNVKVTTKIV
ncbi:organic hydroperoxide resistance protein [Aestuariivirga sp.]|uniref:organic hydroperoxide resistance protein n=1 Tax=Aestuariivirga sp. TaxID=2650926 RepID=UPI0039E26463